MKVIFACIVSAVLLAAPGQAELCLEGWTAVEDFGCLSFDIGPRNIWYNSLNWCKSHGGWLVEIQDAAQQSAVSNAAFQHGGDYWIGLTDENIEGYYEWAHTKQEARYTAWAPGNPLQFNEYNNMVAIQRFNNYMWSNINQNEFYFEPLCYTPFLTNPGDVDDPQCEGGWYYDENFDTCLWFAPQTAATSWAGARGYCQGLGGDLAEILQAGQNIFIRDHANQFVNNREGYWIGLNDEEREGEYVWAASGVVAEYFDWSFGGGFGNPPEPKGGQAQNCVSIDKMDYYTWFDTACNSLRIPLCEKPTQ